MAKNKGRPLKWNSPEELRKRINDYYVWAEENNRHITVSGLAWWLDCNRNTLLNYENSEENGWLKRLNSKTRGEYVSVIKEAKRRIEQEYEECLFSRTSVTGVIFTLKNNYGWADKQEIVNTNNNINVTLEDS